MYNFIIIFNIGMLLLFLLLYSYQIFYAFIGVFKKSKCFEESLKHRYAVIISARNERLVIGQLVESIKKQNYPKELIDVFVVADNCSDDTAKIARKAGAIVYERTNKDLVGKVGIAVHKHSLRECTYEEGLRIYANRRGNLSKESIIKQMKKYLLMING